MSDNRLDSAAWALGLSHDVCIATTPVDEYLAAVELVVQTHASEPEADLKPLHDFLTEAVRIGHVSLVNVLLAHPRIDRFTNDGECMVLAAVHGYTDIAKMLLDDARLDFSWMHEKAYAIALANGHFEIVEASAELLLLRRGQYGFGVQHRLAAAFLDAATQGRADVVQRLLHKFPQIDPAARNNQALQAAARYGHPDVARVLLFGGHPSVDPYAENNLAIRDAAEYGHTAVVELLLQHPRTDPSAEDNAAIRYASCNGHLEVVNLLLQHRRVNPAAKNNEAIFGAANVGHFQVAQVLLRDPRVNPSDNGNRATIVASANGHLEIVQLLLNDPRVDATASRTHCAIRESALRGKHAIVKLLLCHSTYASIDVDAVERVFLDLAVKLVVVHDYFAIAELLRAFVAQRRRWSSLRAAWCGMVVVDKVSK